MPGSGHFGFRSLQQKLGVYAFVLSLLAMVTVSALTYSVARNLVRSGRENLMELLAAEIARDLAAGLEKGIQDVRLWGHMNLVQDALRRQRPGDLVPFLNELIHHHPQYDLILAVAPNGSIVAANTEGRDRQPLASQMLLGKQIRDFFDELPPPTQLKQGQVAGVPWRKLAFVNELYRRNEENSPSEDAFYTTVLAGPVERWPGEPAGALVALINWSYFQQMLDRAEAEFSRMGLSTGYAFLYASDANTIIAHKYRHPRNPRTGTLYADRAVEDHQLFELHRRAKENPRGTIAYRWREGNKITALAAVDSHDLGPTFRWVLGVGINESDIFAPVQRLGYWFLGASLSVAMILVLANWLVGRSVTVSLREFAQLARDAARGSFNQLARARTDDEVGHLAQAFNEMLVSFRAQLPFNQIANPYVVGNPLRSENMFFGREEDLQWIGKQLDHGGNQLVVLYGPRRIGKTSLLHQVGQGRASQKILSFFLDTQQIIPELERDSDFYHVVAREVLAQLPAVLPDSAPPFIAADRFGPETVRKLLQFLHQAAPEKRPVFLFDEFENLEFKFRRGALTSDLLFFLSSLLEGPLPISLVTTGSEQFDHMTGDHWKLLMPKSVSRPIGLLAREDGRRLILDPVHGYVLYDERIPDLILRLTAGHPYYTQLLCQNVVDYLNQNHEFAVSYPHLVKVLELVLNNPPPPLHHVWDNFSAPQKVASASLAHVLTDDEEFARPAAVLEKIPAELQAKVSDLVAFHNAFDQLCREDWMEKGDFGEYRFQVDLLRLWIRREHSVWQVADELEGRA